MNIHQNRYALALANLNTVRALAASKYPKAPAHDAGEEAWTAHDEAIEDIDSAAGMFAAEQALTAAEKALIGWFRTTEPVKLAGFNIDEAMRWPTTRAKVLDIAARAA